MIVRVGPIRFEWDGGELRYLRVGDVEVLRRVAAEVRDDAGVVLPPETRLIERSVAERYARLVWRSRHGGSGGFGWMGCLTIDLAGPDDRLDLRLRITLAGAADETLGSRSAGLVVLHPTAECAGRPCTLVRAAGDEAAWFPRLIALDPLWRDVRELRWQAGDQRCELKFDGETIATEDLRGLGDGAFRSVVEPPSEPRSAAAGEPVRQAVSLRVVGPRPAAPALLSVGIGEPIGPLPPLGIVGERPADDPLFRPDYLRLEAAAIGLARGLPVELVWPVGGADEPPPLPPGSRVVAVDAGGIAGPADLAAVGGRVGGFPVGPSAPTTFAELQRGVPAGEPTLVAWPVCPQLRAVDDRTVMENLTAQADQVATARARWPGAMLCVGPLRFEPPTDAGEAPPDPRLYADFGAVWTLATLANLVGADAVTTFPWTGPRGVGESPVGEVLTTYSTLAGGTALATTVSDPLTVAALAVRHAGRLVVLLANLTTEPITVWLRGDAHEVPPRSWRRIDGAGHR